MDEKKIKLIICESMKEEILAVKPFYPVDYEFVSMDYHLYPKKLGSKLQEMLDQSLGYSRIVLTFGLCGGAVNGLKAANCKLTVPRMHDCISLFFSSNEDYIYKFEKTKGTFYLSTGWMISEKSILEDYDRINKKYGKEKAASIIGRMYEGYKNVLFVKTGCEQERNALQQSKQIADLFGAEHNIIQSKTAFFEKIVNGPWDDKNFINVEPTETIEEEDFWTSKKEV